MAKYLDNTGLQYLWDKLKAKFAPISHTHESVIATGRISSANTAKTATKAMRPLMATGSMKTGKPMADGYIIECDWDNAGGWKGQLYLPNSTTNVNHLQFRGQNGGNWGNWITVYDERSDTATSSKNGLMSATDKAKVDAFSGSGILPIAHGGTGDADAETIYETAHVSVKRWGRMVMVHCHGIVETPSSGNAWAGIDLSAYKPSYNISALVSESVTNGRLARLWVSATDGKVYLNAINGTTSSAWYGTLTYIF